MQRHKFASSFKVSFFVFAIMIGIQANASDTATAENIPDQFDVYWSGAPDAYKKFKSCLPSATEENFKKQVLEVPENTISKITSSNRNNVSDYVLTQGDTFICVHLNLRKKAIIPMVFFKGPSILQPRRKKIEKDFMRTCRSN